jgi:hypothetical protein
VLARRLGDDDLDAPAEDLLLRPAEERLGLQANMRSAR